MKIKKELVSIFGLLALLGVFHLSHALTPGQEAYGTGGAGVFIGPYSSTPSGGPVFIPGVSTEAIWGVSFVGDFTTCVNKDATIQPPDYLFPGEASIGGIITSTPAQTTNFSATCTSPTEGSKTKDTTIYVNPAVNFQYIPSGYLYTTQDAVATLTSTETSRSAYILPGDGPSDYTCDDVAYKNGLPADKTYYCIQYVSKDVENEGVPLPTPSGCEASIVPGTNICQGISYTTTWTENVYTSPPVSLPLTYTKNPYLPDPPPLAGPGQTFICGGGTTNDPYGGVISNCSLFSSGSAAPTVTLTANPSTIVQGNASALTLSSTNATSCTGNNFTDTGNATSGTFSVSPAVTTNYSATCTGPGGSASATTTVTVTTVPTATLVANPTGITAGNSSILVYTCTDSTSASIDQGVGALSPVGNGAVSVMPGADTTYTLSCTGPGGTATAAATVTVSGGGGGGPGVSCSPSPSTTSANSPITWTPTSSGFSGPVSYSWSDSKGTPASGSGSTFTNSYASNGSYSVHVNATDGTSNASADCTAVTIGSGGMCSGTPTGTLTANPDRVQQGNTTTLTWSNLQNISASSCKVVDETDGGSPSYNAGNVNACMLAGGSHPSGPINHQTQFCIMCGATQVSCVVVNVVPAFQNF